MRGLRQRLADTNARGCNRRGKREGKALANADIGGYDEGRKMLVTMVEGTECCHDLEGVTMEEEEEREILRKSSPEEDTTGAIHHWRGRRNIVIH